MAKTDDRAGRNRRDFLDILLAIGTLGWLGSALYPVVRYLKPLPAPGPGGPLKLSDEEESQVEGQGFAVVRVGDRRVLVFRNDADEVRALDAKCTHEGCTVQYVKAESSVWCACHNARFDIDGRVLSGPPPRALAQHDVHRDDDGSLIVTVSRA